MKKWQICFLVTVFAGVVLQVTDVHRFMTAVNGYVNPNHIAFDNLSHCSELDLLFSFMRSDEVAFFSIYRKSTAEACKNLCSIR